MGVSVSGWQRRRARPTGQARRGPRMGLKWPGKARPFQGFACGKTLDAPSGAVLDALMKASASTRK